MADYQIITGDCLDVMRGMDSDSIDLIMTSPPYAQRRKDTYGGVDADKYVDWFMPRANEMKRILKPTGSFVLNIKEHAENGQRHTYVYRLTLAMVDADWRWMDEFIWRKKKVMPGGWKNRLKDGWERLYHFAISDTIKFNPMAVARPLKDSSVRRVAGEDPDTDYESRTGSKFVANWGRMQKLKFARPSNVFTCATLSYNKGHSAAFPDQLPDFFIRLMTDSGDVVLDPFAGSGTTPRVAVELGRTGIGIEILENTCGGQEIQLGVGV